ncbi:hypothetical protein ABIB50_002206 [Mucilaginibacter sp. UYCu711]
MFKISLMSSISTFFKLYKSEQLTDIKKWFVKSLAFFKANTVKENADGILLVQMVKTYDYTIKLAAASKTIAEKNNLFVNLYKVDVNWTWETQKLYLIFESLGINILKKIYLSFGNEVVFNNDEKYKDQKIIKQQLNKIKAQLGPNDREKLLLLKFDDILVGDLIYDSYLRFFHKPTIAEINENVFYTIELALNLFYNFSNFIQNNKIKCLLNTYVSYIQHGIPARICMYNNIDVYTIGSTSYVIQKLTNLFPYHQIDHTLFSSSKLLDETRIDQAKSRLESRFSGTIDAATSYMRSSAYTGGKLSKELTDKFKYRKRNIVLYVHDFYDSPHINRMLQFPDLYEFLRQTLNALTDLKDTSVFIKTHPNGVEGAKDVAIELINSFNSPHFYILDESVSNLNIVELRPDLIGTARGTIGVEMAYFGIPVVALYDNIYANFNFVHTCLTTEEYFLILKGIKAPEIDYDQKNIFSFYYQAFLEKIADKDGDIFTIFASFKGNLFSDDFLNHIYQSEYINYRDDFVNYYSKAL